MKKVPVYYKYFTVTFDDMEHKTGIKVHPIEHPVIPVTYKGIKFNIERMSYKVWRVSLAQIGVLLPSSIFVTLRSALNRLVSYVDTYGIYYIENLIKKKSKYLDFKGKKVTCPLYWTENMEEQFIAELRKILQGKNDSRMMGKAFELSISADSNSLSRGEDFVDYFLSKEDKDTHRAHALSRIKEKYHGDVFKMRYYEKLFVPVFPEEFSSLLADKIKNYSVIRRLNRQQAEYLFMNVLRQRSYIPFTRDSSFVGIDDAEDVKDQKEVMRYLVNILYGDDSRIKLDMIEMIMDFCKKKDILDLVLKNITILNKKALKSGYFHFAGFSKKYRVVLLNPLDPSKCKDFFNIYDGKKVSTFIYNNKTLIDKKSGNVLSVQPPFTHNAKLFSPYVVHNIRRDTLYIKALTNFYNKEGILR